MMLHRHFEQEREKENLTTLADVTPGAESEKAPDNDRYEQREQRRVRRRRFDD